MKKLSKEIWIVAAKRTPFGTLSGALKGVSAIDLAVHAGKAAIAQSGLNADEFDHVVLGNVQQTSADAIYGARHVGLKAGIPLSTPALTVNRLCGSGIQSIVSARHAMGMGEAKACVAGGMENMSQAPFVLRGGRGSGFKLGAAPELEDMLFQALRDPYCGLFMAQTAENVAQREGIPRAAQDEFALRSHQLGAAAVQAGKFASEITPVTVKRGRKEVVVETDDHIKPDTTLEALAKLRPAFGKDGTVTAGNASGIVDGAAALVVTTGAEAQANGWKPRAKIVAWDTVGVEPSEMGIGPAPAIRNTLDKAGVELDQVDLFEINEAFSAQYLAVEKELELSRDKVNVNGGAIALGHPLGATGTRLLLTLMHSLERQDKRYGVASACIGGGQGIAMLIERV